MNLNKAKIRNYEIYEYEIKMEIVQGQRLQLKMKFLLGYNMKMVIFCWGGGIKTWRWAFFQVEEDYLRLVQMMEFY